jgi:hypothetical protein
LKVHLINQWDKFPSAFEGHINISKEEVPYNYKRPATPQQPPHLRPLTSRMPHYRAFNINTKSKSANPNFKKAPP